MIRSYFPAPQTTPSPSVVPDFQGPPWSLHKNSNNNNNNNKEQQQAWPHLFQQQL